MSKTNQTTVRARCRSLKRRRPVRRWRRLSDNCPTTVNRHRRRPWGHIWGRPWSLHLTSLSSKVAVFTAPSMALTWVKMNWVMPEMMTWQSHIRYHIRFFLRVWHENMSASSGNDHPFTTWCLFFVFNPKLCNHNFVFTKETYSIGGLQRRKLCQSAVLSSGQHGTLIRQQNTDFCLKVWSNNQIMF